MMPLNLAEIGQPQIIKRLGGSPEVKNHLEDLGFHIGSEISVVSTLGGSPWVSTSAYFIGMAAIVISGIMLKKTAMFAGNPAPFVMELSAYHWPTLGNVLRSMWERGWSFIKKAGTILVTLLLIVIVALIIRNLRNEKKQGRSSCCGNCGQCACTACHSQANAGKDSCNR